MTPSQNFHFDLHFEISYAFSIFLPSFQQQSLIERSHEFWVYCCYSKQKNAIGLPGVTNRAPDQEGCRSGGKMIRRRCHLALPGFFCPGGAFLWVRGRDLGMLRPQKLRRWTAAALQSKSVWLVGYSVGYEIFSNKKGPGKTLLSPCFYCLVIPPGFEPGLPA